MARTCFTLGKQARQADKRERIYTPSMRERSRATRWLEVRLRAPHVYAGCVTARRRTDELKDKVGRPDAEAVDLSGTMAIQLLRALQDPREDPPADITSPTSSRRCRSSRRLPGFHPAFGHAAKLRCPKQFRVGRFPPLLCRLPVSQ